MLPPVLTDIILLLLLAISIALLLRGFSQRENTEFSTHLNLRFDEYGRKIHALDEQLGKHQLAQLDATSHLREQLGLSLAEHNTRFEQRQNDAVTQLSTLLQTGMTHTQKQVGDYLARNSEELGRRVDELTKKTDARLAEISTQVDRRLTAGFEKTSATFTDILKRLVLIDEAQKKITELSSNVVSLQELLADKRSRGAFGEVQLSALVRNFMPESSYQLQYTLPNNKIADCVLFLPAPVGKIVIDAKFPLESYSRMMDTDLPEADRKAAARQFKQDIRKHVNDIAEKYIIPGTTADGAVMFLPAEAVFAEIHAHHQDLVDKAHAARVCMASPSTLWAILNTARSVLKDAATREQIHLIQEHLRYLSADFGRFEKRMDDLARHIRQANDDVEKVSTSARKISSRFSQIEQVDLEQDALKAADGDGRERII